MAIPIINNWQQYFFYHNEGLGSSYERIIINLRLEQIAKLFSVQKVLEAPCFGFTGISGINSMDLAKNGKSVTLVEHDKQRSMFIKQIWEEVKIPVTIKNVANYDTLPFADNCFDLSWNFSALWFVPNLPVFLQELTRVTGKVVLICVPNRFGIGYLSQMINSSAELEQINQENIQPKKIKKIMKMLGWKLLQTDFIDSPPWPDIGMPKEAFLTKFGLGKFCSPKNVKPISIVPYYKDIEPEFADKMLAFYQFEKKLPDFLKRFWAHHQFYLFIPQK